MATVLQGADAASFADTAYERLKTAIHSGSLKPRARLTEADLVKLLGMSRTPIRHALQRLETEGLVNHDNRSELTVTALDQQAIIELYAAREILEGAAAASSARYASELEIAAMQTLLDSAKDALADWKLLQSINQRFHFSIYDSCHNRFLLKMRNLNYSVVMPGRSPLEDIDAARKHLEQHVEIFKAIRARNPDEAKARAEKHVRYALQQRLRYAEII